MTELTWVLETPDDVRQLYEPRGRVLQSVVEDAVFDGLKNHAICSLDLVVTPWMGHRRVVDVDEAVLAKVPEVRPCKGLFQVGDNPVGYPNWWVMSSMNFAASFDVTVLTARTSIHLVDLSPTTKMCLYPPGGVLKGPIESRPHMAKGQDGGIVLKT
jgi:hypothetical protein